MIKTTTKNESNFMS